MQNYSKSPARNQRYQALMQQCAENRLTVKAMAAFGSKLMREAKLHHHFYADQALFKNALYLTFFALQLPYEYKNRHFLAKKINIAEAERIIPLFEKRIIERIPVEYITQEAYYLGRPFYVNENVLVPRSLMSSQFDDFLSKVTWENHRVLDLCTGSGCIGITLALLNPTISVDLVDISEKALAVARINIEKYNLAARVRCLHSDTFEKVSEKYDLIISNPPYVTEYEYAHQPEEVKNEPKIALVAGEDGLAVVDAIVAKAALYLNESGLLIVEVGYLGAKNVKKKYPTIPFTWVKCRSTLHSPLDGYLRVVEWMIRWSSYLDSIFIIKRSDLIKK